MWGVRTWYIGYPCPWLHGGEKAQMNNPSKTDQWQQEIIDSWRPGTLLLTSGGRLARQLQHRYRLQQLEKGYRSWNPLEVNSLNAWLRHCWQSLWESKTHAGSWLRLHL